MPDNTDYFGSLYKPYRTDSANGQKLSDSASLHALLVFVQFADESPSSNTTDWPIGKPPVYINDLLSSVRKNSGKFWDKYNRETEFFSDYYQEISKGKLHFTGICRHIILDHAKQYYGTNDTLMNHEVYSKLMDDKTIHWSSFDKWRYVSDGIIANEGDGNIDLLVLIRRTYEGPAGFAGLDGDDFAFEAEDQLKIRKGFDQYGSGFVVQGNLGVPNSFNKFVGIFVHELGHFLFGGIHSNIGIMTARGGVVLSDLMYSPFERIKLQYDNPEIINFNRKIEYELRDLSGRDEGNTMLRIPIGLNEYYLVESRRKKSEYDMKMLGDTTRLDLFADIRDYGKGVNIYHIYSTNYSYTQYQDQECADGLFDWNISGYITPDWSATQLLPVFYRVRIPLIVRNDNGLWNDTLNKDGMNVNCYLGGFLGPGKYIGEGKSHQVLFGEGIDRMSTNDTGMWTSREIFGDRYDSWNIGYNEVFSPYSNPNTKNFTDNQTGIFLHYYKVDEDIAHIRIYKTNTLYNESQILQFTPPSRPMGLSISKIKQDENTYRYRISWQHNTEPDMADNFGKLKYKILRAKGKNMETIPTEYEIIDTVRFYKEDIPHFVDNGIYAEGSKWFGIGAPEKYPVRYKVLAVDRHGTSSVPSDFNRAIALRPFKGAFYTQFGNVKSDTNKSDLFVPGNFVLNDVFPNPFNAAVVISFGVPYDAKVNIDITDLAGRRVAQVVNGFLSAGNYRIPFSSTSSDVVLSSGIYFCVMKSGSFMATKRIALVK